MYQHPAQDPCCTHVLRRVHPNRTDRRMETLIYYLMQQGVPQKVTINQGREALLFCPEMGERKRYA